MPPGGASAANAIVVIPAFAKARAPSENRSAPPSVFRSNIGSLSTREGSGDVGRLHD
jgi:hypothetical protein